MVHVGPVEKMADILAEPGIVRPDSIKGEACRPDIFADRLGNEVKLHIRVFFLKYGKALEAFRWSKQRLGTLCSMRQSGDVRSTAFRRGGSFNLESKSS
jgi:hypothetical protein